MAGRPYDVWPIGRPIRRSGAVWELGKCTQWVVSRHVRPSSRKSEAGVTRHNQTKVGHSFFDVGFWGWNGPARLPLRTSATSQKRTFSCDGRPKESPAEAGLKLRVRVYESVGRRVGTSSRKRASKETMADRCHINPVHAFARNLGGCVLFIDAAPPVVDRCTS